MKHLFVPYEIALILKQKGFDEPCLGWWWINGDIFYSGDIAVQYLKDNASSNGCSAPLYQQVVDWFREAEGVHIHIKRDWDNGNMLGFEGIVETDMGVEYTETYPTYYEALTEAINQALNIIQ